MRHKRTTKKEREALHKRVLAAITARGARLLYSSANPSLGGDTYELDTPIGKLRVTCFDDWIACRFDDEKAAHLFDSTTNPYSGKWNHHAHNCDTVQLADGFERDLARLYSLAAQGAGR